jgi:glycosyltransferase involved in cell wall biosynthesis
MAAQDADCYHVATEGPLGLLARRWLGRRGLAYTSSLHTRFPEYVNARLPWLPVSLGYRFLRWFHRPARRTLVTTPSLRRELAARGFDHLQVWGRGVDTDTFAPLKNRQQDHPGPLLVYVGRVAVEKNLQAFLSLRLPGTKMVVGDGPALAQLRSAYPEALFTGYRYGAELAELYGRADVFVFPSRTDTFGLVMLEAMACGTPVAAYPVTGPIDVVREGETGALDEDLTQAIRRALSVSRESCRLHALGHSWGRCAGTFADSLVPARSAEPRLPSP